MFLFNFLKKIPKDKNKIKKALNDKCHVQLSDLGFMNDSNYLCKYLENRIKKCNCADVLQKRLEEIQVNESHSRLLKATIENLTNALNDPMTYYADLNSMLYMGILYEDTEQDSFANSVIKAYTGEFEKDPIVRFIREKQTLKDYLTTVWGSPNNNIDYSSARKNYPVPVKCTNDGVTIQSIPGGCWAFHNTLISQAHFGIFDITSKTTDYKKYSFGKMYDIILSLQDEYIENQILLEYSLGMGYAMQTFHYLKEKRLMDELRPCLAVVNIGADISQFFLRKSVMEIIWTYVEGCDMDESSLHNAQAILQQVKEIIKYIFDPSLTFWSYVYKYYNDDTSRYDLQIFLNSAWNTYFDTNEAYEEWIKYVGIYNWRNIRSVKDCFVQIPGFRYSKAQYNEEALPFNLLLDAKIYYIKDIKGLERHLYVEVPTNEIGEKIIETILKQLVYSEDLLKEEQYHEYYEMREKEYEILRKKDETKAAKFQVKILETQKKVYSYQTYAWLQKNIIIRLLNNIKSTN